MSHFILTPVRQEQAQQQSNARAHFISRQPQQRGKLSTHDGVAHVSAVMERKYTRATTETGDRIEQEEWVPTKLKVAVWGGQPVKEMIHQQALPHGLGYTNFKLKEPKIEECR